MMAGMKKLLQVLGLATVVSVSLQVPTEATPTKVKARAAKQRSVKPTKKPAAVKPNYRKKYIDQTTALGQLCLKEATAIAALYKQEDQNYKDAEDRGDIDPATDYEKSVQNREKTFISYEQWKPHIVKLRQIAARMRSIKEVPASAKAVDTLIIQTALDAEAFAGDTETYAVALPADRHPLPFPNPAWAKFEQSFSTWSEAMNRYAATAAADKKYTPD